MERFSKGLTVLIIITLICSISSLMSKEASCTDPPAPTVKPDIPKPSVPQFTLTYADHSYDVPAKKTSSTDPFTGKVTTTTIPGYHVKNYTVDLSIRNQPYPSTINNGNVSVFRYFVEDKGHFQPEDYFWVEGEDGLSGADVVASNSEYTVVSIPVGAVPAGGAVDFRVQASLGYDYTYFYGLVPFRGWASSDSDWSSVQTITIPGTPPSSNPTATSTQNPTTTPAQNPTPTPTVPEFPSWRIPLLLTIMMASAGLLVYHKKHKEISTLEINKKNPPLPE